MAQCAPRSSNGPDYLGLCALQSPEVREQCQAKHKYILCDEFQDTNKVQYELLKLLVCRGDTLPPRPLPPTTTTFPDNPPIGQNPR